MQFPAIPVTWVNTKGPCVSGWQERHGSSPAAVFLRLLSAPAPPWALWQEVHSIPPRPRRWAYGLPNVIFCSRWQVTHRLPVTLRSNGVVAAPWTEWHSEQLTEAEAWEPIAVK